MLKKIIYHLNFEFYDYLCQVFNLSVLHIINSRNKNSFYEKIFNNYWNFMSGVE